jgi:hypothetical protein
VGVSAVSSIYTAQEKLDAVEREIRQRGRVYARMISREEMTREKAEYEIDIMRAIAEDYRALARKDRLI